MKVFLSWSGDLSHKVACELRDWIPSVLQFVRPYVSSEDIDKGARWSSDIAKELQASEYGVLVITRDNQEAPWICFEAGALSKQIDKSRVSPFLFNLKRSDLRQGPLLQFQSTVFDKEDIAKLIGSINSNAPEAERLQDERLRKVFDVWWPHLQTQLDECMKKVPRPSDEAKSQQPESPAVLEELLDLARQQQKLLRSPEEILPPGYLRSVLREGNLARPGRGQDIPAWRYLKIQVDAIRKVVADLLERPKPLLSASEAEELQSASLKLREVTEYLIHASGIDDRFIRAVE